MWQYKESRFLACIFLNKLFRALEKKPVRSHPHPSLRPLRLFNVFPYLKVIAAVSSCAGPRHMSALMAAADRGSVEAVTAVMNAVSSIVVGTKTAVST